jgi:hypothetical protein
MATKKEIKEHLAIALEEIGKITPWFERNVNEWIFEHPLYPVGYGGNSPEEVIKNYPRYLEQFIKERLNDNLSPIVEKETRGRGGKRKGAGRPKGTTKPPTSRITLELELANWIKDVKNQDIIRGLMKSHASKRIRKQRTKNCKTPNA